MEQRRASKRLRTLLEGRIVFNNRFSLIECTVRDISETGAQIMFAHPVRVPPEFELEVPKKNLFRHARLVWSNGKSHGLMFVDALGKLANSNVPEEAEEPDSKGPGLPAPEDPRLEAPPSGIRDILDEARTRIAQTLGVSVEAVKLNVAFEY